MFPRMIIVVMIIVVGVVGGGLATVVETVIRGGRRGGRQGTSGRRWLLHGALDLLLDPARRLLEFADGPSESPREVGQALSPKKQQHKHEDQQQFRATDVSDECEYGRNHG